MWIKHGSDPKFQVKYAVVHHSKVFNFIGPPSAGRNLPYEKMIEIAERRVFEHNARNNFFKFLQDSVAEQGFRNPIIVRAGWLPTPHWKKLSEEYRKPGMENMMFCDQLGGSRLWTAFKLDMNIPCIIRDYKNLIDKPPLTTEKEVQDCYTDKPLKVIIKEDMFNIFWKNVKI